MPFWFRIDENRIHCRLATSCAPCPSRWSSTGSRCSAGGRESRGSAARIRSGQRRRRHAAHPATRRAPRIPVNRRCLARVRCGRTIPAACYRRGATGIRAFRSATPSAAVRRIASPARRRCAESRAARRSNGRLVEVERLGHQRSPLHEQQMVVREQHAASNLGRHELRRPSVEAGKVDTSTLLVGPACDVQESLAVS